MQMQMVNADKTSTVRKSGFIFLFQATRKKTSPLKFAGPDLP